MCNFFIVFFFARSSITWILISSNMYLSLLMQIQIYILFFISKPITDKTKIKDVSWQIFMFFFPHIVLVFTAL